MTQAIQRYFEDFAVGQRYSSGSKLVDAAAIKAFAAEFDPQVFHLDEAMAQGTFFGGLAASGWHTAAVTMRLLVESDIHPAGGLIGAGFDELRWPRPLRPGAIVHVECEVLATRPSTSRGAIGLVKMLMTTLNQDGEAVQIGVCNLVVQRRATTA